MDAINALEACATHGNAVIFYETVCTPSASERARSLTERYERKEFAKRAMLKHIFKVRAARARAQGGRGAAGRRAASVLRTATHACRARRRSLCTCGRRGAPRRPWAHRTIPLSTRTIWTTTTLHPRAAARERRACAPLRLRAVSARTAGAHG